MVGTIQRETFCGTVRFSLVMNLASPTPTMPIPHADSLVELRTNLMISALNRFGLLSVCAVTSMLLAWHSTPVSGQDAAKTTAQSPKQTSLQTWKNQLAERGIKPSRVSTSVPDSVEKHADLVYAKHGDRQMLLDLFVPKEATKPLPAVMVVHGGGWLNGSKEKFHGLAISLAERGFAAVAVGYRLGGEAKFPAAIIDCNLATAFIRKNASKYGIDPNRIGAVGGSAGGHLVGLMATASGVDAFETNDSKLQAAVVMAGPMELATGPVAIKSRENPAESNSNKWLGKTVDEAPDLYKLASPITHVSKNSPPILFMSGEHDVPERNVATRDLLRKAGVDSQIAVYRFGRHGCWNQHPWFNVMVDDIDAFLSEKLNKVPRRIKVTKTDWGHIDWFEDRLELRVEASRKISIPRLNNPIGTPTFKNSPDSELKVAPQLSTWNLYIKRVDAPATIVVPTIGRPYMPTLPRIVSSAANGTVTLAAHDAVIPSPKLLRYEPQPHKNTVGYWANLADTCHWTFYAERPGKFDLHILQGCGEGHGGSQVGIHVGDQTVKFVVEDTGHFQNFKDRKLGQIELPVAGVCNLQIKPITKPKGAVMDVRQIRLLPVNSQNAD